MNETKETCKDCNNVYCALYNTDFEPCKRIEEYRKEKEAD